MKCVQGQRQVAIIIIRLADGIPQRSLKCFLRPLEFFFPISMQVAPQSSFSYYNSMQKEQIRKKNPSAPTTEKV